MTSSKFYVLPVAFLCCSISSRRLMGDTEDSIRGALDWLKRHQSADGSWKAAGFVEECK